MDGSPVVPEAFFVNLESLETFEKMRKVCWVSWMPSDFPVYTFRDVRGKVGIIKRKSGHEFV